MWIPLLALLVWGIPSLGLGQRYLEAPLCALQTFLHPHHFAQAHAEGLPVVN